MTNFVGVGFSAGLNGLKEGSPGLAGQGRSPRASLSSILSITASRSAALSITKWAPLLRAGGLQLRACRRDRRGSARPAPAAGEGPRRLSKPLPGGSLKVVVARAPRDLRSYKLGRALRRRPSGHRGGVSCFTTSSWPQISEVSEVSGFAIFTKYTHHHTAPLRQRCMWFGKSYR